MIKVIDYKTNLAFKMTLIKQREAQLKQIDDKEALEVKAAKEMPKLIEDSKEVLRFYVN